MSDNKPKPRGSGSPRVLTRLLAFSRSQQLPATTCSTHLLPVHYHASSSQNTHTPPCRVEELKLLSKLEKAGLLSQLEKRGLTLSFIEESGLLSKAEKFGLLSAAADRYTAIPCSWLKELLP